MSQFKINSITNKEGTFGPVIAGVSTNNSTGCMIIPAGPTEHRGGRGRGIFSGGRDAPATPTAVSSIDYIEIATTGNAIDFGDGLPAAGLEGPCGFSNGHGGLT